MRTKMVIILGILISLTGCKSMTGNVVPPNQLSMEQIYDSMEPNKNDLADIPAIKQKRNPANTSEGTFHKLPNPELKMYVYPHLAGNDEVPIPGYYTEFNAYTHDHYVLPSEMI